MNLLTDKNVVCEYLKDGALLVELGTQRAWKLNTAAAGLWSGMVKSGQVDNFIMALEGNNAARVTMVGAGNGPRRRPTPRGASGPA